MGEIKSNKITLKNPDYCTECPFLENLKCLLGYFDSETAVGKNEFGGEIIRPDKCKKLNNGGD